jgi:hypothetical protein
LAAGKTNRPTPGIANMMKPAVAAQALTTYGLKGLTARKNRAHPEAVITTTARKITG